MKLLITMGLADRSLEQHIKPITAVESVEKIIIVRDRVGPVLDKVIYFTPPKWCVKFQIFKTIFKCILLIYLSLKYKPDIIHGFLLFPDGIMSFFAGMLTGKKFGLSMIAGPVELYMPLGGSPIGTYAYNNKLPKITGINRLLLYIVKKMDLVTVTGSFTRNFLIENGVSKNKLFIVPHIVNEQFRPTNSKKIYDIVYIGRLAKVKHIETLLMAISKASVHLPDIKAVIVGTGPEEINLKLLSKDLGLVNSIDFVGYKSNVWDWLNRGLISVLTSEREGFPYAAIEALNCGLPIISSDCGDVCDVVINNYNGIIIDDFNDYNGFADGIVKLLKNNSILNEYSINALISAENNAFKEVVNIWKYNLERLIRSTFPEHRK